MAQTLTLKAAKAAVVAQDGRLLAKAADLPASRLLSALGHPGYGRQYSEAVILRMAATGENAHQVIYGRKVGF